MGFFRNLHTFESLSIRDYRLVWLAQVSTSMGLWMDQVARAWLIYTLTGSPLMLGLVSAARGIPLLVFGAIAGAVADRYGKKAQLIISQIVNAVLNVILAVLVFTGHVQPWHVFVTGFLAGTVQAFQQPARQSMVNDIVGRKHLLNAISLNSAAINITRSIGPAIAGVLIELVGVSVSYFVQAGLYAFATLWTFQIRTPEASKAPDRSKVQPSLIESTREGLQYIAGNRLILALMVLGLAPIVLGMPFITLMPIFAIDVFKGGSETQGILLAMLGIGAVLGALTMASLGKGQTNGKLLVAGAAGFGLSLVLFSRSPVVIMAGFFTLLAGFCNASYTSQDQTIIQMIAPAKMRGRVLGIYLLNRGLMPVGSLFAGLMASLFGGPTAVLLMGASCFVLAIGVAFFAPSLWNLRNIPEM